MFCYSGVALAPSHWRNQRNFVSLVQELRVGCVLIVDGYGQAAELAQGRVLGAQLFEQLLHRLVGWRVDFQHRLAYNFFGNAKKSYFQVHNILHYVKTKLDVATSGYLQHEASIEAP
jgi:hypothetical protein